MSERRDGGYVRSQRLMLIAREIAKDLSQDKICNVENIVRRLLFDMGLTEKTLRNYVDVVCRAKGWVLNDGVITAGI